MSNLVILIAEFFSMKYVNVTNILLSNTVHQTLSMPLWDWLNFEPVATFPSSSVLFYSDIFMSNLHLGFPLETFLKEYRYYLSFQVKCFGDSKA